MIIDFILVINLYKFLENCNINQHLLKKLYGILFKIKKKN